MKPTRSALPLPRYTRRKWLAGEKRWAYFFEPPSWARGKGCPVSAEALGTDYEAAVQRAEGVLLPAFDSWRTDGASDLVPSSTATPGSFDWMVQEFKRSRQFKSIDRATQRTYDQGLELASKHKLKNGATFGQQPIANIDAGVADRLYEALRFSVDVDGNKHERPAYAAAAMRSCRRAWSVAHRLHPKKVPATNPFSKMGIKSRPTSETPTATFEELRSFIKAADDAGCPSLATAALISWEWAQRVEHVFGAFEVGHYRPKERPNAVRVVHPKTGEEAWIPLFDEDGTPLYPELMARLDAIRKARIGGLMIVRDWKDRRAGVPLPWISKSGDLTNMRHEVKAIIRAAKLRDELSFTSFRHGGITEASEADVTEEELRALSRHKTAAVLPRYAKRTMKKVATVARKRRLARTKPDALSE